MKNWNNDRNGIIRNANKINENNYTITMMYLINEQSNKSKYTCYNNKTKLLSAYILIVI